MPQKKPTKAEAAAIKTAVSTSSGNSRRMTGKDALAFVTEVKSNLSLENYNKFLDAIKYVKTTLTKGDETFERGMNILDGFPALCATYELFFSEVLAKKRRVKKALAIVPPSSPGKCFFSRDIFTTLIPLVPYMSMGHLTQTCKWVRGNITPEQIKGCKGRAELLIGITVPVPDQRFHVLFKIYNLKEETVEIGLYHKDSTLLVCRFGGRIYIGTVRGNAHYTQDNIDSMLNKLTSSYRAGNPAPVHTKAYFDSRSVFGDDCVRLFINTRHDIISCWETQYLVMHPLF
jgi:hypothetical protein